MRNGERNMFRPGDIVVLAHFDNEARIIEAGTFIIAVSSGTNSSASYHMVDVAGVSFSGGDANYRHATDDEKTKILKLFAHLADLRCYKTDKIFHPERVEEAINAVLEKRTWFD